MGDEIQGTSIRQIGSQKSPSSTGTTEDMLVAKRINEIALVRLQCDMITWSRRGSLRPARIITGDTLRVGSATTHRRSSFFLSPRDSPSEQESATAAASPLQVLLELFL
ncbi:hypothetical protein LR48_Vigan393s000200 [Vigna angularis]|uniref:Uncharacterized protein n=1 Tax=Phaseolus angularis TaxID=3914 RepID=A0A0L9T907_PHAAN|nr:hypothetical protein LR48_Vigan393s000200 [Vigna angularis]